MNSTTDVQKFVEHVENMRRIAVSHAGQEKEDILYGYVEACRNVYGADSLMVEWITAEYIHLLQRS